MVMTALSLGSARAQQAPGSISFGSMGGAVSAGAPGSQADPVRWQAVLVPNHLHPGEAGRIVLTAHIADGWHIYSPEQPAGGPVPTAINIGVAPPLKFAGTLQQPAPVVVHDTGFNMQVQEFPHSVAFGLPVKLPANAPAGRLQATVTVTCQACNARFCLPPKTIHLNVLGAAAAGPVRAAYATVPSGLPPQPRAGTSAPVTTTAAPARPVSGEDSASVPNQIHTAEQKGLGQFILLSVTFGFIALATPCVFPMIPITVSFFTKQEEEDEREDSQGRSRRKRKSGSNLVGASVYCAGIMGTFTGLGLLLAALFGASGIAQFASNPWVNLAIAAIFLALAANLMGFFELALPSALVNKSSGGAGKGGLLGTLLMGLTFTLTSFTCTVPFVGSLLVSATQGSWLWPAVGMLAFSAAFASPFFLLALFPHLLGRLPRAGSWMASVKAFMGFLEVAAAVKFLSNADLVWQGHVITRPVFLGIWALVGVSCGLYLLGKLRLPHADSQHLGPARLTLGVVMFLTGIYCLAAIKGAPLGWFDAYLPPVGYGLRSSADTPHVGGHWESSFDQAEALAKLERRPIFVDFTGYTCTNCRWMEDHVFPDKAVQGELSHFVLVQLYTDGAGPQYTANRDLEQRLWSTIALPVYGIAGPDGSPIKDAAGQPIAFAGLNQDPRAFARFLRQARARAALGA
ncbi:MAG TPA: cytochrome c biogenesis protein CcdA [Armatimonadota bacterium]|nr:cytochrome c biogenesis protein CcdA [Armatimonadota bacterium]